MTKNRFAKRASRGKLKLIILAGFMTASAVAVLWFAGQSDRLTSTVMIAAEDLPAGAQINEKQVKSVQVNLGQSRSQYLAPEDLPMGAYVLVPVGAGQFIAKSNVAGTAIDSRVPVVVTPSMSLPKGLSVGDSVDVWVAEQNLDRTFGDPYAMILSAEVAAIIESTGMVSNGVPQVELNVPTDSVAPVLSAIASESAISLILRPTLADG